jgi:hypothetical protein
MVKVGRLQRLPGETLTFSIEHKHPGRDRPRGVRFHGNPVRCESSQSGGCWGWILLILVLLEIVIAPGGQSAVTEDERLPQRASQWRLSTTVYYSSGRYGTDEKTTILYVPLTIKRLFQDGDISLSIPYVRISGTGAVRLVGGVGTRTSNVTGSEVDGGGSGGGKKPGASPLSSNTTDSGLGDVILRGRYYLIEEHGMMPLVALTGRIKFPTADADRGLGTGEFDEGAGVELTKSLGDRWLVYLDGGYNLIGDPPDTNFNNQWWYDVGVGHDLTDNLHLSLFYEEYRALVDRVNNARDVLIAADYTAGSGVHMTGSVLVGLSNGAPDYGLSGGIRFQF